MDNKLQELTQRLYDEGLQRGRAEADAVVSKAKEEAEKILSSAKSEAEAIVKSAESEASEIEKNSLTEISLAGRQALAKIKTEISSAITTSSIEEGIKAATMDSAFITEMMLSVAKGWSGADSGEISLEALLPEASKKSLDAAIKKSSAKLLKAGIEVGYSPKVKSGFKIGEKDGGYYISFSDEDFDSLMRLYIRDRVSELLFKA